MGLALEALALSDFRSYDTAEVALDGGVTVVMGRNGHGKTNLIEAVSYSATLGSFRTTTTDVLVAQGAATAVVRAQWRLDGRELLVEADIATTGRSRTLLNRQNVTRRTMLSESLAVSVFHPDGLALVKGGPAQRRAMLDEVLVAADPRMAGVVSDVERTIRQRNALLKQMHGRRESTALATLDVWDDRLAVAGEMLAAARRALVADLAGELVDAHRRLSGAGAVLRAEYLSDWESEGLAEALTAAREDDLRRGISTRGPHRDDLELHIGSLPVRTKASQGEQRTVALALRLAAHRHLAVCRGTAPVLLLDDVFSELDPRRSRALFDALPDGQIILTTAGDMPEGAHVDQVLTVSRAEDGSASRVAEETPTSA